MHNLYTVDIACGKLVKGHDILGVVILDFQQIRNLTVRFHREDNDESPRYSLR